MSYAPAQDRGKRGHNRLERIAKMNTPTEIAKILAECRLACGAEAVARGFPPEAGYDMYYGCYLDALQARYLGAILVLDLSPGFQVWL